MGQALLDGFERGFNMMERHKARMGQEERRNTTLDREEERYQEGQTRLADMDKRNESRYQDNQERQNTNDANASEHRASMLSESQKRTNNQQENHQWQKNQAIEQKKWALIAPQMENIHTEYFNTGKLPEQAANFFKENPEYNDYNPDSYKSAEYRESVKNLKAKTVDIFKNKKLHEFKDPEYIKLFDQAFQSKIKQGVGETDYPRNAQIIDKKVAQLIPTRNGNVSIGLEVTYQKADGETYTEIQPMTKGKTTDKNDPVNEWSIKEIMGAIETRASMADMAENADSYLNRSKNTLNAMGFGGVKQEKAYLKELSAIDKDLTNAISKVQGDSNYLDEESRDKAISQIKQTYQQRKDSLNKNYGVKSEQPVEASEGGYKSSVEGIDANGVIEKFMSVNENMTKEQAIAAATQQGYLTNGE